MKRFNLIVGQGIIISSEVRNYLSSTHQCCRVPIDAKKKYSGFTIFPQNNSNKLVLYKKIYAHKTLTLDRLFNYEQEQNFFIDINKLYVLDKTNNNKVLPHNIALINQTVLTSFFSNKLHTDINAYLLKTNIINNYPQEIYNIFEEYEKYETELRQKNMIIMQIIK